MTSAPAITAAIGAVAAPGAMGALRLSAHGLVKTYRGRKVVDAVSFAIGVTTLPVAVVLDACLPLAAHGRA